MSKSAFQNPSRASSIRRPQIDHEQIPDLFDFNIRDSDSVLRVVLKSNATLESPDFVEGSTGWRISPNSIEIDDGIFRGDIIGSTIIGGQIFGGTIESGELFAFFDSSQIAYSIKPDGIFLYAPPAIGMGPDGPITTSSPSAIFFTNGLDLENTPKAAISGADGGDFLYLYSEFQITINADVFLYLKADIISLDSPDISMAGIPTSSSGLGFRQLWRDGSGYVRIT